MSQWKLYYNPRCGTCEKVKERLESRGVTPEIVEYLKDPPSAAALEKLLAKMGSNPAAITRFKEPYWAEKGIDPAQLGRRTLIKTLAENPFLIQRPIVETEARAVVARPPEEVDSLFDGELGVFVTPAIKRHPGMILSGAGPGLKLLFRRLDTGLRRYDGQP